MSCLCAHPILSLSRLSTLALAGAVTLLAGCASLSGHDTAVAAGPAGDSFYTPPAVLPAGEHGDVIWARALDNEAGLADAAENWLVLYRSTDLDGQPIAVSGTLAVPKGTPPADGWPVISWTHGTTGIADICAPSRNDADYPARGYVSLMNDSLNQWVKQGYAVVKTDYQGLGTPGPHPYLIGDVEARGATDMVLAARQVSPRLSRDWLVMGHSQGGQAALYTAYLGPIYAPNLNLVGAIAISPAAYLSTQIKYAQAHPDIPASAYGALMLKSAATMSPEVDLSKLLTPLGQQRTQLADERCVGQLTGPDAFGGLSTKQVMRMDADFNPFNDVFATLGDSENLRPSVPLLVLQADNDRVVLQSLTDRMVARFRNLGLEVDYQSYHIGDKGTIPTNHQATVAVSLRDAMAWGQARLPAPAPR